MPSRSQPPASSPFSEPDLRFLRDRAWRNRFGRTVVPLVFLAWLGFCTYLYFRVPLLANPWYVGDQIAANAVDTRMLAMLAALCPLAILMVGFVFACLLVFVWGWARMERRYLEILERLDPSRARESESGHQ